MVMYELWLRRTSVRVSLPVSKVPNHWLNISSTVIQQLPWRWEFVYMSNFFNC
jgi:hypothetical protein